MRSGWGRDGECTSLKLSAQCLCSKGGITTPLSRSFASSPPTPPHLYDVVGDPLLLPAQRCRGKIYGFRRAALDTFEEVVVWGCVWVSVAAVRQGQDPQRARRRGCTYLTSDGPL